MAENRCSEEDEMTYYAGLLLELPQLVYMSEFKRAWKEGNWNSFKNRSARINRRDFVDFNSCASLMARLGSSPSPESRVQNNMKMPDAVVAGKKRKRLSPSPKNPVTAEIKKPETTATPSLRVKFKLSPTSSTKKVSSSSSSGDGTVVEGGGNGTVVEGKKQKTKPSLDALTKTTAELPPPAKKHKPFMKVTFKCSGRDGHTTISGHKDSPISTDSDSGVSKEQLPSAACDATKYSEKADQTSSTEKKNIDVDDDKHTNKQLIPDLNIPLIMREHPLPHLTTTSPLQSTPAPMLLQNNSNNGFAWNGLLTAAAPSLHSFNIDTDRASRDCGAAAKERRMLRMMKMKQRRRAG